MLDEQASGALGTASFSMLNIREDIIALLD
jgi:hypothetical protein